MGRARKNSTTLLPELQRFREARNLSQQQLAELVGVDRVSVARWETGTRKVATRILWRVAAVTGIRPEILRPDLGQIFCKSEPAE